MSVLLALFTPPRAHAKRSTAPRVEPVVYEGVRYVVPNDNGRWAYLQAWDRKTTNMLWELTIFRNVINPLEEEDVQWIFIKKLNIDAGKLMVVDEQHRAFSVDLKTRAVKRLQQTPPEKPQAIITGGTSLAMFHSARGQQWDG